MGPNQVLSQRSCKEDVKVLMLEKIRQVKTVKSGIKHSGDKHSLETQNVDAYSECLVSSAGTFDPF